jgi:4-amino-4-deoxy-L-arabinose transferase-like glycosyltransferase
VVLLGLALRLWHVRGALPDFLDEAIPFKTALRMWTGEGRVDWNPHFFNYPSLTIYLQLLIQGLTMLVGRAFHAYGSLADYLTAYETDPTAMVIAARLVGVAADGVTIACVIRIGERMRRGAGLVAGAVVALAPTMIVTSRSIYTDTVMTAFALAALERLLAWREGGRRASLATATVLAGLAAGSKYPAAVFVVPLAWVLIERRGVRGLGTWALASAAALGVFLVTSPYVALDFHAFRQDFLFESSHMASGHLGSGGRRGFLFQLDTLARDVGWPGLALLAVSLARSIVGPRRGGDRVTLWLFALPLGIAISLARVEAERYLMPVIPIVALLGADAALELLGLVPRARRLALPLAFALCVAPVVPAGLGAAASGGDDTQAAARRWTEANVTTREVLLREGYTGALLTRARVSKVSASRGFGEAGEAARRRFLSRRAFASVDIPLVVAG